MTDELESAPQSLPRTAPQSGYLLARDVVTLRDYFAARAMEGIARADMTVDEIAVEAYRFADAMLGARKK